MQNSISINPALIAERQRLSARQLTSLNTHASLPSGKDNLDSTENTPAYILDLSNPAINQAANKLQAASQDQTDQQTNLEDSPAYIVDLSSKSIRLAKEQAKEAKQKTANSSPETLISQIQGQ